MNRWVLFGIIIASTIAIAFPVYLSQTNPNQPLIGNYLFAGLIIEGIVLFLIQNHTDNKRRDEDRKEKHTQTLNEKILEKIIDVQPRIDRHHKLVFQIPNDSGKYKAMKVDLFAFDDEEMLFVDMEYRLPQPSLGWTLKHIESYSDINKPWKEAKSLVDNYNNSVESIEKLLNEIVVSEMSERFSGFKPVDPEAKLSNEDLYDPDDISRLMYRAFEDYIETGTIPTFDQVNIEPNGDINYVVIRSQNIRIVQSSKEILLNQVKELLLAIFNNQNLQQQFLKLGKIHEDAKEKTRQFGTNLAVLVSELNEGALLKGKCKLGY